MNVKATGRNLWSAALPVEDSALGGSCKGLDGFAVDVAGQASRAVPSELLSARQHSPSRCAKFTFTLLRWGNSGGSHQEIRRWPLT